MPTTYRSAQSWRRELEEYQMGSEGGLAVVYLLRNSDGQPLLAHSVGVDAVHVVTQEGAKTYRSRAGHKQLVIVPFDAKVEVQSEDTPE